MFEGADFISAGELLFSSELGSKNAFPWHPLEIVPALVDRLQMPRVLDV